MIGKIIEFMERGATRVIVGRANECPSKDFRIGEIEKLYSECGILTIYNPDRNTIVFEVEG